MGQSVSLCSVPATQLCLCHAVFESKIRSNWRLAAAGDIPIEAFAHLRGDITKAKCLQHRICCLLVISCWRLRQFKTTGGYMRVGCNLVLHKHLSIDSSSQASACKQR